MARCYESCKHYSIFGFCEKYGEMVCRSKNPAHYGLLLHPLDFLEIYYSPHLTPDVSHLIEYARKYLTDEASTSIINYYDKNHKITISKENI